MKTDESRLAIEKQVLRSYRELTTEKRIVLHETTAAAFYLLDYIDELEEEYDKLKIMLEEIKDNM